MMKKILKGIKEALNKRNISNASVLALLVAVIVALNAVVYSLTTTFGLYLYSPERSDLSVSDVGDTLFYEAIKDGKTVKIMFCLDEDTLKTHDTGSFVYTTVKNLAEKYPGLIEMKFINILTMRDEKGNYVDLTKYKKDVNGNDTALRKNSVIFEYGLNYRTITDTYSSAGFADFFTLDAGGNAVAYNGEEVVVSMMRWVLQNEHKSVYLTTNHGESLTDSAFTNMLTCAGYYVETINLRNDKIPDDAAMVIISNPISDFQKGAQGVYSEIEKLEDYIAKGGYLYVSIDSRARELPRLEALLEKYGINIVGGTNEDGRFSREFIKDNVNGITTDGFTFVATATDDNMVSNNIGAAMKKYGSGKVIMKNVARLELSGNAQALLVSSADSVTELAGEVVNREGSYPVAAYTSIDNEYYPDARIVVVPTVYLTVSDALVNEGYSNKDFLYITLNNIFGASCAPYGTNAVYYNQNLLEGVTARSKRVYTWILMLIPAAIAVSGFVIMRKRRNR